MNNRDYWEVNRRPSRMDYNKHPQAKLISVGVGVALLIVLFVWAFTAV